MEKLLSVVEAILKNPITWGIVAIVALAIAVSGKVSMSAANYLSVAGALATIFALYRIEYLAKLRLGLRLIILIIGAVLISFAFLCFARWLAIEPQPLPSDAPQAVLPDISWYVYVFAALVACIAILTEIVLSQGVRLRAILAPKVDQDFLNAMADEQVAEIEAEEAARQRTKAELVEAKKEIERLHGLSDEVRDRNAELSKANEQLVLLTRQLEEKNGIIYELQRKPCPDQWLHRLIELEFSNLATYVKVKEPLQINTNLEKPVRFVLFTINLRNCSIFNIAIDKKQELQGDIVFNGRGLRGDKRITGTSMEISLPHLQTGFVTIEQDLSKEEAEMIDEELKEALKKEKPEDRFLTFYFGNFGLIVKGGESCEDRVYPARVQLERLAFPLTNY